MLDRLDLIQDPISLQPQRPKWSRVKACVRGRHTSAGCIWPVVLGAAMAFAPACVQGLALQATLGCLPGHSRATVAAGVAAGVAAVGPHAQAGRGGAEGPRHGILMEDMRRCATRQLACTLPMICLS